MSGKEIMALFFIQDGNTTHKWRLKGHAEDDFWRWLASWSVAIRMPEDLGYANDAFQLPPLRMHDKIVEGKSPRNTLFDMGNLTLAERRQARRFSLDERVDACAQLVNESSEPWLGLCALNAESAALSKAIPDAVEVKGADSSEHKESALLGFSSGAHRVLVTKPSIAGHGMNWQHCSKVAFVGLSDSFEAFYQAVRRCWRFGQERPVDCHIITSNAEGAVRKNIERKEVQAALMMDSIVKHMKGLTIKQMRRDVMNYEEEMFEGRDWKLYLGDAVQRIDEIESDSVGLSVFSPPFPGMYAYTNSVNDMGNVKSIEVMIEHFRYLVCKEKLLRVLMPGRSCCIHLTQVPAFKSVDGYIGLKDFRGAVIDLMEEEGWIYYGEVCIDKDPQVKAIRTKDRGLLFKTLAKDSANMHMALADYLLQFRKPGDNPKEIRAGISERYENLDGWITPNQWIEWAAPVWYRKTQHYPGGIKETEVLEARPAKDKKDEKHLCPLQLGVIERAIKLWSNPGDTILSPFAGIGSEGYQAIKYKRKFIGVELKRSYAEVAVRNLRRAAMEAHQPTLLDSLEEAS
jgi:DNA modification methylase